MLFTLALVPTGMNTGVSIWPWAVVSSAGAGVAVGRDDLELPDHRIRVASPKE